MAPKNEFGEGLFFIIVSLLALSCGAVVGAWIEHITDSVPLGAILGLFAAGFVATPIMLIGENASKGKYRYFWRKISGAKPDHEQLMAAVKSGDVVEVQRCIAAGVGVNATTSSIVGMTALHRAALFEKTEVAKALLAAGADVNATDKSGMTALHWAASNKNAEIAKALLAARAHVNVATNEGRTALHEAACNNCPEIVKVLIAAGADMKATDEYGDTALFMAKHREHAEVARILQAAGAK